MNEQEGSPKTASRAPKVSVRKKRYNAPALTSYGAVNRLTQSGSGPGVEGASGKTGKHVRQ